MRFSQKRLRILVVELLVVILGVIIALAADSWREEWIESQEEKRYLQRIARDLQESVDILNREWEIFTRVRKSALILGDAVESGERLDDGDFLISHLIQAGQHGVDRAEMERSLTFREMIESGRIGLIDDPELREDLIAYHREVDWLIEQLSGLPRVNRSISRTVGLFPAEFGEFGAELTSTQRENLLALIRDDPELLGLLRMLHAGLVFSDRLFARLIPMAQELADAIDATTGQE